MSDFNATQFLVWWFDTHYIWSTLLTPGPTIMWAIYNDLTVRAVVVVVLWLLAGSLGRGVCGG